MEKDSNSLESHGIYSNFFRVGYGAAEFLLDFGRQFEGMEENFCQRIIMSPAHARILTHLLQKSLSDYEQRFGALPEEWGS
jgi:hypothetical protein